MIKSVTFPEIGEGYIYEKIEKPIKPEKNDYRYRGREDRYDSDMKEYKEEMAYYRKNKGKFILPCSYNLVGKTFSFENGKINLIFGPNGSGKSTIIKAIAGNVLCDDGFTSFAEPIDFGFSDEERTVEGVGKIARKKKQNDSIIDMDAIPVYYDNFEHTRMSACGSLGDLMGSIIQDVSDEVSYIMASRRISSGQHSLFVLNRIMEIAKNEISMKDVIDRNIEMKFKHANGSWKQVCDIQCEYFRKFDNFETKSHPVLLFDEIDKSLDIETVWKLYTKVFPMIVEKWGNQIIMVSHNPLVLSDTIFKSDDFNIVSVDQQYTDDMKSMLNGVRF